MATVTVGFVAVGELARLPYPAGNGPLAYAFGAAEVAAQVRMPFGAVALVGLALVVLVRAPRAAFLATAVATLVALGPLFELLDRGGSGARTASLVGGRVSEIGPDGSLAVVFANVLWPNPRRAALFDAIAADDPDLIALAEVSAEWREAALERFAATHPYHAEGKSRDDWDALAWGQMLLSRHPLEDVDVQGLEVDGRRLRPVVWATVVWGERRVRVAVAHPYRPGAPWRFRARRTQLRDLAEGFRATPLADRILLGDLNTTSCSPWFRALTDRAALVDTRRGHGRQPTWFLRRPWFPDELRVGIAIDHVLCSRTFDAVERSTFTLPGSDHAGVRARLR